MVLFNILLQLQTCGVIRAFQGIEPAHIIHVGQFVSRINAAAQLDGFIRASIVKC